MKADSRNPGGRETDAYGGAQERWTEESTSEEGLDAEEVSDTSDTTGAKTGGKDDA